MRERRYGLGLGGLTQANVGAVPVPESAVKVPSDMIAFGDGHVEAVPVKRLLLDNSDAALRRWNNNHEPGRSYNSVSP